MYNNKQLPANTYFLVWGISELHYYSGGCVYIADKKGSFYWKEWIHDKPHPLARWTIDLNIVLENLNIVATFSKVSVNLAGLLAHPRLDL